MGRYFGIGNKTKRHIVSGYWKGDEFCDAHTVMHLFGWGVGDVIYTACYDTYCVLLYDVEKNTLIPVDYTMESMAEDFVSPVQPIDETGPAPSSDHLIKFKFSELVSCFDHPPRWKDGKCTTCGFYFDEKILNEYKEGFDPTYHMN